MTERGKRPHSAQVLERWAQEYATRHDLVKKRVQEWISYMVLASKLESASRAQDGPTFVIKAGVALEMRLRDRARATTDIDLIVEVEDADDMVAALGGALESGYEGFTLRVKDDPYPMEDGSTRAQVVLEYRERGWGTVQVDLLCQRVGTGACLNARATCSRVASVFISWALTRYPRRGRWG